VWPKTVVIGAEYDDDLRDVLGRVLRQAGAERKSRQHAVVGSQEIETWWYRIGRHRLKVEAETYIGLSLRGAGSLVEQLAAAVRAARPA
jgi:hypothetical protein